MVKHSKDKKMMYEIEMVFNKLIGPIATMRKSDVFSEDNKELEDLLDIISIWSAKFQLQLDLSYISPEELLDVYNRLDKLKEKYLYEINACDEVELSDEAVIWM